MHVTPSAKLHANVKEVFVLVILVVLSDIWVVQLWENCKLSVEEHKFIGAQTTFFHGFDCYLDILIFFICSFVNFAVGSGSKEVEAVNIVLIQ